jgi:hypothetical protein
MAASWMTYLLKSAARNTIKTFWIKSVPTMRTLSLDNESTRRSKVLFLGNGGAGKTQLCRRLCDLDSIRAFPALDARVEHQPIYQEGELLCVTARFPIGSITSAPLRGQMLLCSLYKASAIRAINGSSIRPPKWTIFHLIASPRSAHGPACIFESSRKAIKEAVSCYTPEKQELSSPVTLPNRYVATVVPLSFTFSYKDLARYYILLYTTI